LLETCAKYVDKMSKLYQASFPLMKSNMYRILFKKKQFYFVLNIP